MPRKMIHVRDARATDALAISEIYNDAVENSTAIWTDRKVDRADRSQWVAERQAGGFPVLVATSAGQVTGFATYGPFRPYDGYRHTVELSLYVHAAQRGQGIGRSLLAALIDHAGRQDVHTMVAAIEAENTASIALHRALGFSHSGTLPQVGTKFSRWLDLAFLTLVLGASD